MKTTEISSVLLCVNSCRSRRVGPSNANVTPWKRNPVKKPEATSVASAMVPHLYTRQNRKTQPCLPFQLTHQTNECAAENHRFHNLPPLCRLHHHPVFFLYSIVVLFQSGCLFVTNEISKWKSELGHDKFSCGNI